MCELTVTERRLRFVDFTEFTFLDQTTFISQSPGIANHDWLLGEVGNYFWLLNLCSFLAVLLALSLISCVLAKTVYAQFNMQITFSFQRILLKLYGIYLRQCKWRLLNLI